MRALAIKESAIKSHSFKDKLITLSISIPVTETVNLRLLLSIPVIVVKDLKNKISSSYTPELKMFFSVFAGGSFLPTQL